VAGQALVVAALEPRRSRLRDPDEGGAERGRVQARAVRRQDVRALRSLARAHADRLGAAQAREAQLRLPIHARALAPPGQRQPDRRAQIAEVA
jgi:hypothetical protein